MALAWGQDSLFQSTPVIADGRTPEGRLRDLAGQIVSIHARHC